MLDKYINISSPTPCSQESLLVQLSQNTTHFKQVSEGADYSDSSETNNSTLWLRFMPTEWLSILV